MYVSSQVLWWDCVHAQSSLSLQCSPMRKVPTCTDPYGQLTIPHIPWVVLWSPQYNVSSLPWLQIHHSTAYWLPSSPSLVYLPLSRSTSLLNVCEQRSALMRLCFHTVSSEHSLLTHVTSTKTSSTDPSCQLTIPHILWVVLWSPQYNVFSLPWQQIHHSKAY